MFIVFVSLFSISSIFYFILELLVYPLPIFTVAEKKWAGKNSGFIWDRAKHSNFSTKKLL
jgi:HJR/Mrr/RecB family endonuclease